MNELLEAALQYAARGWPVVPLHDVVSRACSCGQDCGQSQGKHPRTEHGHKQATTDEQQIRAWWQCWPNANIGIATGARSGLVVIDVDPRHNGWNSLDKLEQEHGVLPATLSVVTGGNGLHLYYQHPGPRVPSRSSKLAPGIDVRGDDSLVAAPPSLHISGNRYMRTGHCPTEPAAMPSWLIEAVKEREKQPPTPRAPMTFKDAGHWLSQALQQAHEGNRNETGLWLACQLRDDGVSQAAAERTMLHYAAGCPAGNSAYTDREALATLKSAYSSPPREPARDQRRQSTNSAPPPPPPPTPAPMTAAELLAQYPELRRPVIHDLLREAEITNLIAASKVGKSWLVLDLALSIATGRVWLGRFQVRHPGHASRMVPITPKLMTLLLERSMEVPGGGRLVTKRGEGSVRNLLARVLKQAGVERWPKLFQTLRSSCEKEWAMTFPQYAVSRWIGHSITVSGKHYANSVPDELFERAAGATHVQNAAQNRPKSTRTDSVDDPTREPDGAGNPRKSGQFAPVPVGADCPKAEEEGFEPP